MNKSIREIINGIHAPNCRVCYDDRDDKHIIRIFYYYTYIWDRTLMFERIIDPDEEDVVKFVFDMILEIKTAHLMKDFKSGEHYPYAEERKELINAGALEHATKTKLTKGVT